MMGVPMGGFASSNTSAGIAPQNTAAPKANKGNMMWYQTHGNTADGRSAEKTLFNSSAFLRSAYETTAQNMRRDTEIMDPRLMPPPRSVAPKTPPGGLMQLPGQMEQAHHHHNQNNRRRKSHEAGALAMDINRLSVQNLFARAQDVLHAGST